MAFSTINGREKTVAAFAGHADEFPWLWTPTMVDEWLGDLRAVRHLKRATLRAYQEAVRSFCSYITDPAYAWPAACEQRFGTHPVQVVHEWNTAVHVQDGEADPGKRAFTLAELEALFDHADAQVARVRTAGRKGWLPAFRDAALFRIAYGYGLRRNEVRMLDMVDFGRNPHGPEYGDYGLVYVRHGKAKKGSAPKRRSVLTVWDWTPGIIEQWITEVRPAFGRADNLALWPSERAERVALSALNARFATYRDAIGLDRNLDFHSLRRSYVTHLIEAGYDARFVQEQAGHDHASTTSIYTCVSSDYRTRTLRRALDETLNAAPRPSGRPPMKRQVSYKWRLREVMAMHGMFSTTELVAPLRERGINLSVSQVHRLATGTPERLSLPVLAALCDIFDATPADLIATKAENAATRKTATDDAVIDLAAVRPKRVRLRPEG